MRARSSQQHVVQTWVNVFVTWQALSSDTDQIIKESGQRKLHSGARATIRSHLRSGHKIAHTKVTLLLPAGSFMYGNWYPYFSPPLLLAMIPNKDVLPIIAPPCGQRCNKYKGLFFTFDGHLNFPWIFLWSCLPACKAESFPFCFFFSLFFPILCVWGWGGGKLFLILFSYISLLILLNSITTCFVLQRKEELINRPLHLFQHFVVLRVFLFLFFLVEELICLVLSPLFKGRSAYVSQERNVRACSPAVESASVVRTRYVWPLLTGDQSLPELQSSPCPTPGRAMACTALASL